MDRLQHGHPRAAQRQASRAYIARRVDIRAAEVRRETDAEIREAVRHLIDSGSGGQIPMQLWDGE